MIKNKPKVFVYNGPISSWGQNFSIPEEEKYISLTQYVTLSQPSIVIRPDDQISLPSNKMVAFPEEYFSVTENFIHSFWSKLDENPVEEVYLFNPPTQIIKQAEAYGLDLKITEYSHDRLSVKKVVDIHELLSQKIHGQALAIERIAKALISLTGKNTFKPIVLMFYGPAGIGKTETAKLIAEQLGGQPFRAQFSMMQTSSLSDYLYGNKTSDRSLASDLLERETNVLLFDEFDKTTEHFHSAFYQLFDEGVFTDKNYNVDVKGAIVICTSNYGSPEQIKQHLGDALYSRLSNLIPFNYLNDEAKQQIARENINSHLAASSDELKKIIPAADKIYEECGPIIARCQNAREIEQVVKYYVSDLIYKHVINGKD